MTCKTGSTTRTVERALAHSEETGAPAWFIVHSSAFAEYVARLAVDVLGASAQREHGRVAIRRGLACVVVLPVGSRDDLALHMRGRDRASFFLDPHWVLYGRRMPPGLPPHA